MSRIHDRDALIAQLSRELPDRSIHEVTDLARRLMRAGTTLQRLAEAQCNGDWPADHGDSWKTEPCQVCESCWHPSVLLKATINGDKLAKVCPDCRTQARVTALLAEYGMRPIFQGDPRGAVFKVIPPSYADRNAGREPFNYEGIYVS